MPGKLQHPDEQRQLQVNDKLITNRATAVEDQLRGTRRRGVPLDVDRQLLSRADGTPQRVSPAKARLPWRQV